jgi:hypothetical protein
VTQAYRLSLSRHKIPIVVCEDAHGLVKFLPWGRLKQDNGKHPAYPSMLAIFKPTASKAASEETA